MYNSRKCIFRIGNTYHESERTFARKDIYFYTVCSYLVFLMKPLCIRTMLLHVHASTTEYYILAWLL